MALPMVISFTFRFMFQLVDAVYAARLGTEEVAAIGFYAQFNVLYIALWVGLSAGFTAGLSGAFGRRDEGRIRELKQAMMRLLYFLVPTLTLLGGSIWFWSPILPLEEDVLGAFRIYATTLLFGLPITGLWSIYPDSVVKAHHDTRSTMMAGLLASITNVSLNTLFMFGFGWGIFGIAFATVISRLVSLAYAMHRTRILETARQATGAFHETSDHPYSPPLRMLLALSVPAALTYALSSAEGALVNWLVALGDGQATVGLASFHVYSQTLMLGLMPTIAASVALLPYLARNVPAGLHEMIRQDLRRTISLVLAFALLATVLLGWVFGEGVARYFLARYSAYQDGDAAVRDEMTAYTVDILRLLPLAALLAIPFTFLRPVFEALHKPRLAVRISLLRYVALSFPLVLLGYAVGEGLGVPRLYAMVAGLLLATGISSTLTLILSRRELQRAAAREATA